MRRTAASLFVIASLATAGAANAQSFNCGSAHHPDEQTICRDPYLSKLDSQLAQTFARVVNQLPPAERKELGDDEEDWVVSRRQCGADPHCIAEAYRTRIGELTGVTPPPGSVRPNPSVAAGPREGIEPPQREASAPPPPRQARPEPVQTRPQPPVISERQPAPVIERTPFPVVERPPEPLPGQPPFPIVERPPQAVIERPPAPAAEPRRQSTTVESREAVNPERRTQPSSEPRDQASTEQRPQPSAGPPLQSSAERKQPAARTTANSGSSAPTEEHQEQKSPVHDARKPAEASPASETAKLEHDTEHAKRTRRAQHRPKQHHAAVTADSGAQTASPVPAPNPPRTASAAPAAAAPSGGAPAKPSIQWVDPPPAR